MVMDSAATDNYVDPALTPGLRAYMRDVEELRAPHTIVSGTTVSTRADHVRVLLQCSGCFLGRGLLVFCRCRAASGGV